MEEIMRIKQAVIPAILALSAAGSILIGSVASAAAVPAASATVAVSVHPLMIFHD
jgi:hypothetical protein